MAFIAMLPLVPYLHQKWLFNKIGSQTVFIRNMPGAKLQGSATGFEIQAPSGKIYTLTNAHVCELELNGYVMVQEKAHSDRLIPRRVLEVYANNDLCLVEGLEGYEGLSLASDYQMQDLNWASGYPQGEALNFSSGFLKAKMDVEIMLPGTPEAECKGPGLIWTSAETFFGTFPMCAIIRHAISTNISIFPGNSGSPMVNLLGNVTGIIFASNSSTSWGYAVPLEDIKEFLKPY